MQQFLKRRVDPHARILAAELLAQFLVAMDDAFAALDRGLGGMAATTLARSVRRKSRGRLRVRAS
ncbi:MAG: hypothetical protein JF586_21315 [Burkholderiales bacterium]|nr:hypothetical protein [Burkholderiales bacterium]